MKRNISVRLGCLALIIFIFQTNPALSAGDNAEPQDVPTLIKSLQDKDPAVRAEAAARLGGMKEKAAAAVPELILLLGDDHISEEWQWFSKRVCDAAKRALKAIGRPAAADAVPALAAIVAEKNGDWWMREAAAETLGKIGPVAKTAVPQLIVASKDDDNGELVIKAIEALGLIGPSAKAAVPRLLEIMKSNADADNRQAARDALQKIAPNALPPAHSVPASGE